MTFCGIASAPGEGGIGIVRMAGDNAFNIGRKIFRGNVPKDFHRRMLYGHIIDEGRVIDEVLIVFMKSPKTYTGLDTVEIYTHGGNIATRRVFRTLLKHGARPQEPGEFTKEAFLNGRIDLIEAQAVSDMVKAKTDRIYNSYLEKLQGSLSKEVKTLINLTVDMLSNIDASIDYPEEDLRVMEEEELKERLKEAIDISKNLIKKSENSRILREGIDVVILGKPNVGKSSLLNHLLGIERAIVSDIPGTTRDTLEEYLEISGIPLKITDTAGIRDSKDMIEKIGVDRAKTAIEGADLLLAIFDISSDFQDEDLEILSLIEGKRSIVLWNKTDLGRDFPKEIVEKFMGHKIIKTSIKDGDIGDLYGVISEIFNKDIDREQVDTMLTERESFLLKEAYENFTEAFNDINRGISADILTVNIEEARKCLLEITGEMAGEEVIDKIFSEFCLGK